jgi:GDPmannose 4,6-dehydratase
LNYRDYAIEDPQLYRPSEVNLLLGDSSKARQRLGWDYGGTFEDLIREMVEEDLRYYQGEASRTGGVSASPASL